MRVLFTEGHPMRELKAVDMPTPPRVGEFVSMHSPNGAIQVFTVRRVDWLIFAEDSYQCVVEVVRAYLTK